MLKSLKSFDIVFEAAKDPRIFSKIMIFDLRYGILLLFYVVFDLFFDSFYN